MIPALAGASAAVIATVLMTNMEKLSTVEWMLAVFAIWMGLSGAILWRDR